MAGSFAILFRMIEPDFTCTVVPVKTCVCGCAVPTRRQRPEDQPQPTVNSGPSVQEAVIDDILSMRINSVTKAHVVQAEQGRKALGIQRYGTTLQPYNGRDAKQDAREELLDFVNYAKQNVMEGAAGWTEFYRQGLGLLLSIFESEYVVDDTGEDGPAST